MRNVVKRFSKLVQICEADQTHPIRTKKIAPKEGFFGISYDVGKGETLICFDCYNAYFSAGIIREGVYFGKNHTEEPILVDPFEVLLDEPVAITTEIAIPTTNEPIEIVKKRKKVVSTHIALEAQNEPTTHLLSPDEEIYQKQIESDSESPGRYIAGFMDLPLDKIIISEANHRDIDPAKFECFKESIKLQGILTPILVTPDYELIAGYHRVQAAKELELTSIPARIIKIKNKAHHRVISMIENFQRNDLDDIAKAKAIKLLKDRTNASASEIATLLCLKERTIHIYLKLLQEPEIVQKAVAEGRLSRTEVRLAGKNAVRLARATVDRTPEQAKELKAKIKAELIPQENIFKQTYKIAEQLEQKILEMANPDTKYDPHSRDDFSELVQLLDNRIKPIITALSRSFAVSI